MSLTSQRDKYRSRIADLERQLAGARRKVDWMEGASLESVVPWNMASQRTLNMMCESYQTGKQEVREARAAQVEMRGALEECQRLAIERVKTADAAVKTDVYAADALMGIAVIARRALASSGSGLLDAVTVAREALKALEPHGTHDPHQECCLAVERQRVAALEKLERHKRE